MEFLLIIILIFVLVKQTRKRDNKKSIFYYILLFIALFVAYYFIIAILLGFILSLFGEYMHYYGIIIGMAISPLLSIITIFKINKKNQKSDDE